MSEYWKSTPKYWCKFCKAYVRDTPFDKRNHDATPKHQGNIQRSLRTMHREHEREDRDKQRAQYEVARLNGIVSGVKSAGSVPGFATTAAALASNANEARPDERKRQLKQLADLGVAIPEDFRADMAMVGDWRTLSQRQVSAPDMKTEDDVKPEVDGVGVVQSVGIRKRKHEGVEEEEEARETVVRRGWGSTIKKYPGHSERLEDIEALLKGGVAQALTPEVQSEPDADPVPVIKREGSLDEGTIRGESAAEAPDVQIKPEPERVAATTAVVFKKRKAKVARGG